MRFRNPGDPEPEYWYRYDDQGVGGSIDECGDVMPGTSSVRVVLWEFEVLKHTPKGVWLDGRYGKRFVLHEAYRRYACSTKEDAMKSFLARKRRQISIYEHRIRSAKQAIELAQHDIIGDSYRNVSYRLFSPENPDD